MTGTGSDAEPAVIGVAEGLVGGECLGALWRGQGREGLSKLRLRD